MQQTQIIRGTNDKPASSQALVDVFARGQRGGTLFIGFPIINSAEGPRPIDALWLSPAHGAVVFDLVEGNNLNDFADRQDEVANKLESRLRSHGELVERRTLSVPILTISFGPAAHLPQDVPLDAGYVTANIASIDQVLETLPVWTPANASSFDSVLSAIQNISTVRKSRFRRVVKLADSRGARLKKLEDSIATLDSIQGRAVVETVNGVQRIRGLAGSGKTIVLALKAAYLHAQHPDWKIGVTFSTRSLKNQFRKHITNFMLASTGEEPDWSQVRVINAWGASGGEERSGIYFEFCSAHGLEYLDFRAAKSRFGQENAFNGACSEALAQVVQHKKLYDVMLVDEAQDFPGAFLRICLGVVGPQQRLVYAYDELQTLSGGSVQSPELLFGQRPDGSPVITFGEQHQGEPKRDVILERCYRNSRPVLATAHALGFGIYRLPAQRGALGLVQMFDHASLWTDIGYQVVGGAVTEGQEVILRRTEETSPRFLEAHSLGYQPEHLHYLTDRVLSRMSGAPEDALWAWLREVREDQGALLQLTAEAADLFNATISDREGVDYACVCTASPPPRDVETSLLRPLDQGLYRLIWNVTSRPHRGYAYPALSQALLDRSSPGRRRSGMPSGKSRNACHE